jgi:excisionase family DNA binding protein
MPEPNCVITKQLDPTDVSKAHYTPDEVAAYYRISTKTLYRWVEDGWIRAIKAGGDGTHGAIRIPREAILEFNQQNETVAATK